MAAPGVSKRFDRALQALDEISDPLTRLDEIRRRREALERLEVETVIAAREAGSTWRTVGQIYGLSKQGAQQRFRPLIEAADTRTESPDRGEETATESPETA